MTILETTSRRGFLAGAGAAALGLLAVPGCGPAAREEASGRISSVREHSLSAGVHAAPTIHAYLLELEERPGDRFQVLSHEFRGRPPGVGEDISLERSRSAWREGGWRPKASDR